jgi:hypothetical protein
LTKLTPLISIPLPSFWKFLVGFILLFLCILRNMCYFHYMCMCLKCISVILIPKHLSFPLPPCNGFPTQSFLYNHVILLCFRSTFCLWVKPTISVFLSWAYVVQHAKILFHQFLCKWQNFIFYCWIVLYCMYILYICATYSWITSFNHWTQLENGFLNESSATYKLYWNLLLY